MKPVITYALIALLLACVIGYAVAPLADHLKASVSRVSRVLRTSPRK
jgi:hypothetical protein